MVDAIIAIAVTVIVVAALGQAVRLVGDATPPSRDERELRARLRTVTFQLGDELRRRTARIAPPQSARSGDGYFLYYDGPMSDASSRMFGPTVTEADETADQAAGRNGRLKYGDFDDYLAFTAVADGDDFFTGLVPRFVVRARERQLAGDPHWQSAYSESGALDPIEIRSKYAEIIYWVAPERDEQGAIRADPETGAPLRMRLHRRVLLIRPDLNLQEGRLASFDSPQGGPMQIDSSIRSLAAIHQQCDLSVRRPLDDAGRPLPLGDDLSGVIANNLSDLTRPHHRFAHIRLPETDLGLENHLQAHRYTSMPILDLAGPAPLLVHAATARPVEATGGFLHPAYALSGERQGDDVVLDHVVAFDLRGYDPHAPVFIGAGADGAPGSGGTALEDFGALGSDDVVIGPGDAEFGRLLRGEINTPSTAVLASRGAYVDLDYAYKAGAPAQLERDLPGPLLRANLDRYCHTPLSGYDRRSDPDADPATAAAAGDFGWRFPTGYLRSGKVLVRDAADSLHVYQPAYDTWVEEYLSDEPHGEIAGQLGTVWITGSVEVPAGGPDRHAEAPEEGRLLRADEGEKGVPPPLDFRLPGIEVRVRVEDPATAKIHQVATTRDFAD